MGRRKGKNRRKHRLTKQQRRQRGRGGKTWVVTLEGGQKVDATVKQTAAKGNAWANYVMCHHVAQPLTIKDPKGEWTVYAGGKMDMTSKDAAGMDWQVPLCDVLGLGAPYAQGFRGRILFTPAPDGGTWPMEVYKRTLHDIRKAARAGKRVLVYCLGGHGRTGTMLAGLVGLFEGADDPIAEVRARYCKEAVEGVAQCQAIYELLDRDFPDKYRNEVAWWDKADIWQRGTDGHYHRRQHPVGATRGNVYYPVLGGDRGAVIHPEAATADGPGTVLRTEYGTLQRWSDAITAPVGMRFPALSGAPTLLEVEAALVSRYGSVERLSGVVKRVLLSATLQTLPGWTEHLWWVYGDGWSVVDEPGMVDQRVGPGRWEAFLMYKGHPTILDGHITVEYGKTPVAPTMSGRQPLAAMPQPCWAAPPLPVEAPLDDKALWGLP